MPSSKIWTLCSYGCSCIWLLNAHVLHTQKRNMGLISEHLWWSNLLVKLQLCSLELNNKRTSTTNVLLDFFCIFKVLVLYNKNSYWAVVLRISYPETSPILCNNVISLYLYKFMSCCHYLFMLLGHLNFFYLFLFTFSEFLRRKQYTVYLKMVWFYQSKFQKLSLYLLSSSFSLLGIIH